MSKLKLHEAEKICTERAMDQWERSLKRPDLSEKDRVMGAIQAYQSQMFVLQLLEKVQNPEEIAPEVLLAMSGENR